MPPNNDTKTNRYEFETLDSIQADSYEESLLCLKDIIKIKEPQYIHIITGTHENRFTANDLK